MGRAPAPIARRSAASSADHLFELERQIVVIGTDSYIVNATVDDTEIGEIATGDQVDIMPTGSTTPATARWPRSA